MVRIEFQIDEENGFPAQLAALAIGLNGHERGIDLRAVCFPERDSWTVSQN